MEWIKCSERMPDNGRYLIAKRLLGLNDLWVHVASYAHDGSKIDEYDLPDGPCFYAYDSEYGYYLVPDVEYWMPLLEPPAEKEDTDA